MPAPCTPTATSSRTPDRTTVSPLVLADRLISLAQDADRAGLHRPAANLMRLAIAMCDEQPRLPCLSDAWSGGEMPNA